MSSAMFHTMKSPPGREAPGGPPWHNAKGGVAACRFYVLQGTLLSGSGFGVLGAHGVSYQFLGACKRFGDAQMSALGLTSWDVVQAGMAGLFVLFASLGGGTQHASRKPGCQGMRRSPSEALPPPCRGQGMWRSPSEALPPPEEGQGMRMSPPEALPPQPEEDQGMWRSPSEALPPPSWRPGEVEVASGGVAPPL